MKRIVLILVAACSMEAPPAWPVPIASTARPAPSLPVTTDASTAVINCAATNKAAEYCANVLDACCGSYTPGTWVCNNTRYEIWFAQQCKQR